MENQRRTNIRVKVRAALAFTSPESNVGLTPLPCPWWWKYGVGDTLPKADTAIAGGTLRREGAAADNRGTSAMDGTATEGGGWMCNSGAASPAARDRDLRCSRRRRLSSRSFP